MAIMDFNYGLAIRQANQVDEIAKEMQNIANRQLQSAVDSIEACWQGDASKQFLGYCTTTQEDIRIQARKLQDLANRVRTVARIIEEAEQRAKEAQRRAAEAARSAGGGSGGGGGGAF
jgi:WXG100 family type VII secretion target